MSEIIQQKYHLVFTNNNLSNNFINQYLYNYNSKICINHQDFNIHWNSRAAVINLEYLSGSFGSESNFLPLFYSPVSPFSVITNILINSRSAE